MKDFSFLKFKYCNLMIQNENSSLAIVSLYHHANLKKSLPSCHHKQEGQCLAFSNGLSSYPLRMADWTQEMRFLVAEDQYVLEHILCKGNGLVDLHQSSISDLFLMHFASCIKYHVYHFKLFRKLIKQLI